MADTVVLPAVARVAALTVGLATAAATTVTAAFIVAACSTVAILATSALSVAKFTTTTRLPAVIPTATVSATTIRTLTSLVISVAGLCHGIPPIRIQAIIGMLNTVMLIPLSRADLASIRLRNGLSRIRSPHCGYVPLLAVLYAKPDVISFADLGRV
ncbi:hypothetical protein HMPREF2785_09690 [Corynebacterium sp. HMSC067D03]|nr:hypothetical protein HMPREF2785_09690 [Corynebacterium sp. HMSC067D03]OFO36688.1 hypothetical protein HMPREF3048_01815 [Corynebacterium sp. HMSC075D04]OHQ51068.1 hypothetical protein HMPREF2617_00035 [Corynebacterium sp. HMSC070H05]